MCRDQTSFGALAHFPPVKCWGGSKYIEFNHIIYVFLLSFSLGIKDSPSLWTPMFPPKRWCNDSAAPMKKCKPFRPTRFTLIHAEVCLVFFFFTQIAWTKWGFWLQIFVISISRVECYFGLEKRFIPRHIWDDKLVGRNRQLHVPS